MEVATTHPNYEVEVARSSQEAGSLRTAWESLLEREPAPAFDSSPDRYEAILESQADAHPRPHILLIRKRGEPVAMVLGKIWTLRLRCSIGYLTFSLPPLRCLDVKHGWILGQVTGEVAHVLLTEIRKSLRSSEAQTARFQGLNTQSALYEAIAKAVHGPRLGYCGRIETHRTMRVPASLDAFYQSCSHKHRANLRRYYRNLEERYGKELVITRYDGEDAVDLFGTTAEQISVNTYQHALGSGIVYDRNLRSLMRHIARRGWLRGHILFLDGEPCAFQYGVVYRGQYFLEQMGFDPRWKDQCVGTYLFLHVLRELCRPDSGVRTIDFGSGDADYKSSYGDNEWKEAHVFVFAPHLYPISVNLLRTSITGLNLGIQRMVDKVGVTNWLKRTWRNRLQKPAPAEPQPAPRPRLQPQILAIQTPAKAPNYVQSSPAPLSRQAQSG
jgi:hypothetical protein